MHWYYEKVDWLYRWWEKCLLLKGEWYYYNDDYIDYLKDSIEELDVIYKPEYDFGKAKLKEYQNKQYELEKDFRI